MTQGINDTLAICRTLAVARATFAAAIAEKAAGRFMIRDALASPLPFAA